MMREMFEQYLRQSDPLFERLDTVQTQLGYTETLIQHFIESNSPRYFFQRMPCFSGLLTGQMLERHLVPEMPMRDPDGAGGCPVCKSDAEQSAGQKDDDVFLGGRRAELPRNGTRG